MFNYTQYVIFNFLKEKKLKTKLQINIIFLFEKTEEKNKIGLGKRFICHMKDLRIYP